MSLDLSLKDTMSKHRMLWNYISEYYTEAYKIYNHFERYKRFIIYGNEYYCPDSKITETQYRLFEKYKEDVIKSCFCITDDNHEYLNLVNNCFLCDYTSTFIFGDGKGKETDCSICPCLNRDGKHSSSCLNGLYLDFTDACYRGKFKKASKLAKKIANLPTYSWED